MSGLEIVAVIFCLAGFGLWVLVSPRIWRNEWKWAWSPDQVPAGWPYGGPSWRAFARLTPLGGVALGVLPLTFLVSRFDAGWAKLASDVLIGASMLLFLLIVTVSLFNRPKFAVAPHLRHQPGLLDEWRGTPPPPTQPPRV